MKISHKKASYCTVLWFLSTSTARRVYRGTGRRDSTESGARISMPACPHPRDDAMRCRVHPEVKMVRLAVDEREVTRKAVLVMLYTTNISFYEQTSHRYSYVEKSLSVSLYAMGRLASWEGDT